MNEEEERAFINKSAEELGIPPDILNKWVCELTEEHINKMIEDPNFVELEERQKVYDALVDRYLEYVLINGAPTAQKPIGILSSGIERDKNAGIRRKPIFLSRRGHRTDRKKRANQRKR